MDIAKKMEGGRTVISVTGRVDTTTAPELDAGLKLEGTETLTLDLSGVPYMSSAGLPPHRPEDDDGGRRFDDHRGRPAGRAGSPRHHGLQRHPHAGLMD